MSKSRLPRRVRTTYAIRMPAGAHEAATGLPATWCENPRSCCWTPTASILPCLPTMDQTAPGLSPYAVTWAPCSLVPLLAASQTRPSAAAANATAPRGRTTPPAVRGWVGLVWCFGEPPPTSGSPPPVAASVTPPNTNATAQAAATSTSGLRDRARGGGSAPSADARARSVTSAPGSSSPSVRSSRSSSSSGISLPFRSAQVLERPGQARVHRAHRQVEQVGDRGRRVAEPVAQDDHDPALRREPGDGGEQLAVLAGPVAPFALDAFHRVGADQAPLAAQQVERAVDHDPVQPWPERPPPVEAAERRERALERVLGDVVGHVAPAGDGAGDLPRARP